MIIELWVFSKRRNSTAVPNGGGDWTPDVYLKNPSSVINPIIVLRAAADIDEIMSYNYMRMAGRYYFINEWTSVRRDLWECRCELDVLATYKNEILSTTAYIEFDTTTNAEIADSRLAVKTTPLVSRNTAPFGGGYFSSTGRIILSVTGTDGSVDSFATYQSVVNDILNDISNWSDSLFEGLSSEVDALVAIGKNMIAVGNAANNIRSCRWIPWLVEGSVSPINLGKFVTGYTGYKITSNVHTFATSIAIPWHFSDWRNSSPYSTVYLYIPFIGNIAIPASLIQGQSEISIQTSVDNRTGDISVYLRSGNITIGTYGGSTGVDIPIGVSNVSPSSILNSVGGIASSLAMGNLFGALGGVNNAFTPNVTTVGGIGNGSGSGMPMIIICSVVTNDTVDAPGNYAAVVGTPSGVVKQLASLTGYIRTRQASVKANCGASILDRINAMLDGGIYIE